MHWKKLCKSEGGVYFPEEAKFIADVWRRKHRLEVAGVLSIVAFPGDASDEQRDEVTEILDLGENLIVDWGKDALRQLQALTTGATGAAGVKDLGFLAVGDGGVVVTPATTTLANELTAPAPAPVPRPALAVTAPPPGPPFTTNLWTGQIGPSQLNGSNINEAALYCLDGGTAAGTMFAARSFAIQAKVAGIAHEYRWTTIF